VIGEWGRRQCAQCGVWTYDVVQTMAYSRNEEHPSAVLFRCRDEYVCGRRRQALLRARDVERTTRYADRTLDSESYRKALGRHPRRLKE
jgi:hypothetical protein